MLAGILALEDFMSQSPVEANGANDVASIAPDDETDATRILGLPLYAWVILAVLVAIPTGLLWGGGATRLEILPTVILRALTALAAPLVVLAILSAIVTNDVKGRLGALDDGLLSAQHPGGDADRPHPHQSHQPRHRCR